MENCVAIQANVCVTCPLLEARFDFAWVRRKWLARNYVLNYAETAVIIACDSYRRTAF